MTFPLIKIKCTSLKWKNKSFINYGNHNTAKTLKYVGEMYVKLST